ncbi:oligodendrocyte-myelin glycoprotein-like [Betta splendens]|uniref:Oligodendrocyte-myelin glycoprotein-like n=1 Tax=Betta splendens TaxID=158456 RepID=A0A6P7PFX9_BETSP|nr:oligodendrocyte-myelin glycoprotein-like [Betta splendens]
MTRGRALLKTPPGGALLALLLPPLLAPRLLAVCPSPCSCAPSHREADCSRRGLRLLPGGLQRDVRALNLSHNRLQSLDAQLSAYTHLRVLDLSHNRLGRLPAGLPRSLWQLHVAANRLQVLDKEDTVHQWNLRALDLSGNRLRRAVFINNTLSSLCTLNLSRNSFWTLPTNLPAHLQAVDLSHNLLVKVLPGSLDRLPRLSYLYLQANRLSSVPPAALDKLPSLRLINLADNPWACDLQANVSYLLGWSQQTPARVLGCPCHTQPVCGGTRPARTGGWHFASYNMPPLAASAQDRSSAPPGAAVTPQEAASTPRSTGSHSAPSDHVARPDSSLQAVHSGTTDVALATDGFFTTESPSTRTKKTTTLRTRSVRRKTPPHPSGVSNSCPAAGPRPCLAHLQVLGLLPLALQRVL